MSKKLTFITTGDITAIATMKRALGMANPLSNLGWQISIIALDCESNRERISLECKEDISTYYYQSGSVRDEVDQKTELVQKLNPDYIYLCSFSARNRVIKSRINKDTKVILEHSELASSIPDRKGIKKIVAYLFEIYSVIYAHYLVCASTYLVEHYGRLAKKVFKNNIPIEYSPYAYNDSVMDYPPIIINQLHDKYQGKNIFLYMGTMTRNYGLFTMLQAAELLKKRNIAEKFTLLMMGKGRHLNEAQEYVKSNGLEDVIEFTGYTPETHLSSYFERADAFISPLNNTVQDLARCPSKIYMYLPFQKPVFTCKLGEPYQIFGESGYYFDNEQPDTLADLMQDFVQRNVENISVDIEQHSWKKRAENFTNWIYDTIK